MVAELEKYKDRICSKFSCGCEDSDSSAVSPASYRNIDFQAESYQMVLFGNDICSTAKALSTFI